MEAFIGRIEWYPEGAEETAFLDFRFLFAYNKIELLWITMHI